MTKISGIVNTYNEEENIGDCLNTIDWVDEIIIVDANSRDRTVEIARKFTNKIYQFSYSGYVESARNFALSKATGGWLLILDADERLPSNARKIIRKLVQNESIDGYWFPRRNYINEKKYLKYGYFYPDYQMRLFRNRKSIKYSEIIHEQPTIDKDRSKKINNLEVFHNCSHSKYNSFFSFKRFFPYIRIEGKNIATSNKSNFHLLIDSVLEVFRHFYRSFVKLNGYRDGYCGFRASSLYALYKGSILFFAVICRIKGSL